VEIVICLRHLTIGDNFRTVGQVAGDKKIINSKCGTYFSTSFALFSVHRAPIDSSYLNLSRVIQMLNYQNFRLMVAIW
jgi:hypothetical protein